MLSDAAPRAWSAATAHVVVRVLAGVAAVAYVAARAALVPLTYDEVSSLHNYALGQPANLVDFTVATNHLLNSVLMRASSAVFGDAPWALRLPNVLAAAGYVAAAAAFARRLHEPLAGTGAFVLLVSNPYVLDYLGLARGYGLATALLFGAVAVLVSWWEQPRGAIGQLTLALGFAGAAVAANFGVLFGMVAIVTVAGARLAWVARLGPAALGHEATPRRTAWRTAVVWLLVALAYNALVFSRSRVLAPETSVPTTVRITGLFDDELAAIQIFRADSTGRLRQLARTGDTWTSGGARDLRTLRVALTAFAAENLAAIDVTAGAYRYAHTRQSPGPWRSDDFGAERVLVFTAPLDWQGGRAHTRLAAVHAVVVTAALALLGLAGHGLARAGAGARLVPAAEGRVLVQALLGVATLAAAPLYLLQRDGELFFGGRTGLVADTFGTLVTGSLYGAGYHPQALAAGTIVLGVLLTVVTGLALVSCRTRGRLPAAAAVVLSVLALVCAQVELLHRVAGAPYPMARTAVFLLPILLALPALAADAAAGLSRRWSSAAGIAALVVAAAGVSHWAVVANVASARDWPEDAAAVDMLALVAQAAPRPAAARGVVRVGVDWIYYPVVNYYAGRERPDGVRLDAVVLPGDGPPVDFVYVRPPSDFDVGDVVARYPGSGAVLRKTLPRALP